MHECRNSHARNAAEFFCYRQAIPDAIQRERTFSKASDWRAWIEREQPARPTTVRDIGK